MDELREFFCVVDNAQHRLMFEVIYELGCRVGEFVRIQVKHLQLSRSTVFFPEQNTKTRRARTSCLPSDTRDAIKSMLLEKGIVSKRDGKVREPNAYLFHPGKRFDHHYTENRIRQVFQKYVNVAGLQQVYGSDTCNRNLNMFTVHSLRHSHIMHYVVDRGVPLPIVQKQVGHRSLKTTSVYLSASTERMARAYDAARDNNRQHMSCPSYKT